MPAFKTASNEKASASFVEQRGNAVPSNFDDTSNEPGLSDASARSLSQIAQALETTGDYRVLRRLKARDDFTQILADEPTKIGVVIDNETTGLNTQTDEVIEIAMIKFEYTTDGRVVRVHETFNSFNEPTAIISPGITELTGITPDMVAGHHIDPAAVALFASNANVVIAHNAKFDRPFAERYSPEFQHLAWACSATQVDWRALGFDGARLAHLLNHIGLFYDAHRALDDCRAVLEILDFKLPSIGATILSLLVDEARRQTVRIWALNAPFALKEDLKRRHYRWNDGSDGRPRSWFVDVDESCHREEIEYLRKHIFRRDDVDFHIQRLDAFLRFSNRI